MKGMELLCSRIMGNSLDSKLPDMLRFAQESPVVNLVLELARQLLLHSYKFLEPTYEYF